jgi:hypothetical protein
MSVIRILHRGMIFQAVEQNDAAGTLMIYTFTTKRDARIWTVHRLDELARMEHVGPGPMTEPEHAMRAARCSAPQCAPTRDFSLGQCIIG